jgi:hypothetical protein
MMRNARSYRPTWIFSPLLVSLDRIETAVTELPNRSTRPSTRIPVEIVPSVGRCELDGGKVTREFRDLIDNGAKLRIAGSAKSNPMRLFTLGYTPKHKIELFDTQFYLTNVRQNPELRFLVAYVVQKNRSTRRTEIFPRIFYKDLSLVWRSASHFSNGDGLWIGKGATYGVIEDGYEIQTSKESTTDLPIEMQSALEDLLRWTRRPPADDRIIGLVLREAPEGRVQPYADFTRPRDQAATNRANLINGGRNIARFTRRNDPTSLRITRGFEPDFAAGVLETSRSKSRVFHCLLKRFRILSTNRKIQYGFIAGPRHVWIIPPQATTTELSSFGVRTIDVIADDDLFIPGYEYHYVDEPELEEEEPDSYSQIPEGFAGCICEHDDQKADASPWLDQIPVIREFRRKVLKQRVT